MKVTFPHMGNLYISVKAFFEELGVEVVVPPMPSKRTISLGTLHSPEFACLPLKVNIGNYIEAMELGADTIAMAGGVGPCRFGLYGEVQRQILESLGYDCEMIVIEPPQGRIGHVLRQVGRLVGRRPIGRYVRAGRLAWAKMKAVDRLDRLALQVRAFERERGAATAALASALKLIDAAKDPPGVAAALAEGEARLHAECGDEGEDAPRIGIVGEVYMVLEPFINCGVERHLGEMGAVVDRSIYVSEWAVEHVVKDAFRVFRKSTAHYELAKPYLCHFVGGHGLETIGSTVDYARRGFHGVIQIAPFTCMPEIVAQDILPTVSKDLGIPVMSLVIDEHSSDTGIATRLEAFVDLARMSRRRRGDEIR